MWSQIQVACLGVHFNYKKERQFICLCYTVAIVLSILLITATILTYVIRDTQTIFGVVVHCGSATFRHFIWVNVLIIYIILIRYLEMRFNALNYILRFDIHFIRYIIMNKFLDFEIRCFQSRNKFPAGNTLQFASDLHKRNAIIIIKFIGRQHKFLTSIMELLNACYSFQVTLIFDHIWNAIIIALYKWCVNEWRLLC